MQDHGLFQAVCRVNRLDGDDKDYGYIIDYMDLFDSLKNAFTDYTSGAFDAYEKADVEGLLKDRLQKGRERLDEALEAIKALCEPVEPPQGSMAHIRYFCGKNTENPDDLKDTEPRRVSLYKLTIALIRAYANIADEMIEAGYTPDQVEEIKNNVNKYLKLREEIRIASGEKLDLKTYEADMRHLIDTYIQADDSRRIDPFGEQSLLEIMVNSGMDNVIKGLPDGIRSSKEAVAETIENNVRVKIIKDHLIDPAYFSEMSTLLSEVVRERKAKALNYEEYLKRIAELANRVVHTTGGDLPVEIKTNAQRALYNNLSKDKELAISVDSAIKSSRRAEWRGNIPAENLIKKAMYAVLDDTTEVERIFQIVKQQNDY